MSSNGGLLGCCLVRSSTVHSALSTTQKKRLLRAAHLNGSSVQLVVAPKKPWSGIAACAMRVLVAFSYRTIGPSRLRVDSHSLAW